MMNLKPTLYTAFALTLLTAAVACSQDTDVAGSNAGFVAVLQPTDGNDVSGTVQFSDTPNGVRVSVDISGLDPATSHGFHIHEFGDCSAGDASSAGGHFNPGGEPHGAPQDVQRHAGDLGNVTANSAGVAQTSLLDTELMMSGERSVLGHAVVIHANADDLRSQPAGDAGPRLACGVIAAAN